ncbi:MAG: nitrite/sulfite reductase [Thermoleophilia bacterium]|nr:nitrite/sulfite reductase [Thermoleophilia bacterium]
MAALTWDTVYERNSVERIKRDRPPLGIREELPALIAAGYERVPEEDIVRLQWWGLYHDKPKIGTFMLRVKIPGGILTPAKLRAVGEVANRYGRGDAELTTRQCIQLHWLELGALPDVLAALEAVGITTAGGCGDTVRNITGCPVSGVAADELFDSTPVIEAARREFYGNPAWANLPRKHKYSIASCPDRCNAPEINCVSLVGVLHEGREGYAVLVGGGLSSVPRLARELGVFVPKEEAVEILGAVTSVWSEDLRYRMSRVKARLKFMVDDLGPEGMLERVEAKLGRALERFSLPPVEARPSAHVGVHPQRQPGLSYVGVPVRLGLVCGDQLVALADLAQELGGDVRVTRQQNLILTGVPDGRVDEVLARLRELGLPLETSPVWANAIACTGEPHCNFSVGETKTRLEALVRHLESTFGEAVAELRLNLDGCPHACAQHWVGDLGFQATTGKDAEGNRVAAYDVFVRGGLGPEAAIGSSLFRRVPSERLEAAVEGLVRGWLSSRAEGESFAAFQRRLSDEELGALAGLDPARKRVREEVGA